MLENSASFTLLIIAMIATFNCLVRSDYNLVIALVCYFFWLSRYDKEGRVSYVVRIIYKTVVRNFEIGYFKPVSGSP